MSHSYVSRIAIMKMISLLKELYRLNAHSVKIATVFFTETKQNYKGSERLRVGKEMYSEKE